MSVGGSKLSWIKITDSHFTSELKNIFALIYRILVNRKSIENIVLNFFFHIKLRRENKVCWRTHARYWGMWFGASEKFWGCRIFSGNQRKGGTFEFSWRVILELYWVLLVKVWHSDKQLRRSSPDGLWLSRPSSISDFGSKRNSVQ